MSSNVRQDSLTTRSSLFYIIIAHEEVGILEDDVVHASLRCIAAHSTVLVRLESVHDLMTFGKRADSSISPKVPLLGSLSFDDVESQLSSAGMCDAL